MPTRKSTRRRIRSLIKLGGASIAVTIPIEAVRRLHWKEKQKVVVTLRGRTLLVADWKKGRA